MSGIVFFRTRALEIVCQFYRDELGCQLWLNQGDCRIFRHGNFLFGFCRDEKSETEAVLTFFYPTKEAVDNMYARLKPIADKAPVMNRKYRIYHFYAHDPERRRIEFQYFDQLPECYLAGEDLLRTRRSVREFADKPVPEETFLTIINLCRFAPTAKNSQSFYFKPIHNKQILEQIAAIRERSSSPIAKAPMAVAICSDPIMSRRYIQDACIGAYHFLLAAWLYGLGTVWIADLNREEVKEILEIPQDHYIATITPLGYPREQSIRTPMRKPLEWYLKK